jgi:hypothetical protein
MSQRETSEAAARSTWSRSETQDDSVDLGSRQRIVLQGIEFTPAAHTNVRERALFILFDHAVGTIDTGKLGVYTAEHGEHMCLGHAI